MLHACNLQEGERGREGKSSHQEYQDLRLHELQLSTAQRVSYCYARAQSAQLEIRERERERAAAVRVRAQASKPRDGEEQAGEKTAASEQRAGRLQLDLLHMHTRTHLYTRCHDPFFCLMPLCRAAASWEDTQREFTSLHQGSKEKKRGEEKTEESKTEKKGKKEENFPLQDLSSTFWDLPWGSEFSSSLIALLQ